MKLVRAYAQLVRLPNVFTAFADVAIGGIAFWSVYFHGYPARFLPRFTLLMAASGCLYCAGMVWNDYFDVKEDARERPGRPIPSGRISRRAAARLACALVAAGIGFAALAGWSESAWSSSPLRVALALVVSILGYDAVLKRTIVGPLTMGLCRFLNVLLGFTLVDGLDDWLPELGQWDHGWMCAEIVGLYVVGITCFAQRESGESEQLILSLSGVVMLAAFAMAWHVLLDRAWVTWAYPAAVIIAATPAACTIGYAIYRPTSQNVQTGVKNAIFGLIVLDATLAMGLAGPVGLWILALAVPAYVLGRFIYST
jgi:4-hydroxybenzoate polyprenyltransferase